MDGDALMLVLSLAWAGIVERKGVATITSPSMTPKMFLRTIPGIFIFALLPDKQFFMKR
jgi:hypothetical protein